MSLCHCSVILIVWMLAGCALVPSPSDRADEIARQAGLSRVEPAGTALRAYLRAEANPRASRLVVYIESDGAYWVAPNRPPADPTPIKHHVLRMAASDPGPAVAYLGRPCQYLDARALENCDLALWTRGRFSEAAVTAVDRAVTELKAASKVREVALVGYSGGGAMAALVAARRDDVACLVSVAAPLDTQAWTRTIGVSALQGSHNPLDVAGHLAHVPQTHFSGSRDEVVPPGTIAAFVAQMKRARVVSRVDFDHDCCWARDWSELLAQTCLVAR